MIRLTNKPSPNGRPSDSQRNFPQRLWLAGRRVLEEIAAPLEPVPTNLARHQRAALDWLCLAQDMSSDGGVSAGFHLKDGWLPSYPETTGYIACTFFDQADEQSRPELAQRAWRMIEWLLTRQLDDGGFPGRFGSGERGPIVFNTGQILFGLVRAAERDRDRADIREAAMRAGRWLTEVLDSDGSWRRCTHSQIVHSYNSRTAWALLRCWQFSGEDDMRAAALRNLDWDLRVQHANGFPRHAGFERHKPPYLHTIAYAIRGLLEAGLLLERDELIDSARRPASLLAERMLADRSLAGAYDESWRPAANYRCLTGEAQMAVIWARLFLHSGRPRFLAACQLALRCLAASQDLHAVATVRGAIAGSYPIWGRYSRFEFPNWAAKFFVDAVSAFQRAGGSVTDGEAVPCV